MIATLAPAYFAMVMATGIVSIAVYLQGFHAAAAALFWLNAVLYAGLWTATLVRFARYRDRLVADLLDHGRSVGFFTTVAATCVLGSQCVIVMGAPRAAFVLWVAGVVLWLAITYTVVTVLSVKSVKPPLERGLNGGWLLLVVAPQSVSVLAAQVAAGSERILLFALVMWLGAGMLYLWIISLIFYRYTFFTLGPSDLAPPYWINMGAVAISTLAGAMLVKVSAQAPLLTELVPFIKGLTLLFWATATWWIPMLVALGVWRHIVRRFPLRYDPLYWGAVFPLGMYAVCTFRLTEAIGMPSLLALPVVFTWIAVAAWTLAFAGFVLQLFAGKSQKDAA
jgi:tellurite resistance protein TehA-like permease